MRKVSHFVAKCRMETSNYSWPSLLGRAENLIPVLRDRAAETSEARQMSEATITDFWNSGLFNLLKPAKFGGPEVRPDVVFRLTGVLARGDGSAGAGCFELCGQWPGDCGCRWFHALGQMGFL